LNAIRYLEVLGRNPVLAALPPAAYDAAVSALDIDARQQQALIDRDGFRLNALLGGRREMKCLIFSRDDESQDAVR
jgi:hypothetical protein